jgi:hypothetical protein
MSNGTKALPPVLNTLTPTQSASGQNASITLDGSGFDSGVLAVVTLEDGTTIKQYSPTGTPSATAFTVTIPAADITGGGTLHIVAQNSNAQQSAALPYTVLVPPQLVWVSTTGLVAQPNSNWIYTVSRPMVSPGSSTPFRAYKYDGTVPYGYQQEIELGLYDNALSAQNACQWDFDAASAPVIVLPPTDGT